jgi:hypothetical protein
MRKSFTRFLSVFMLFCAFGLQAALAVSGSWDGTKSIPVNTDANVKPGDISTQFVLAFTETPAVTAAGGTLVVYKGAAIVKLVPITQSSADVSVSGKNLVVKHGIPSFAEGSGYSITLSLGAVTSGGGAVSIAPGGYVFTIGDFTPPVLAATDPLGPPDGQTGVKANLVYPGGPVPFVITMKFNENIAKGTGEIAIYNANGTVMDIIRVTPTSTLVSIVGETATITVDNASYFAPETDYFVKVDGGTFTDATANANKYVGISSNTAWNFSTRDNSAPVITATVPAADITATSAKLNVSISEAGKVSYKVDGGAYTAPEALAANTNKVYTITGLSSSNSHTVYVLAENNLTPPNVTSTPVEITFTTKDDTGPVASFRDLITEDKKTTGVYILFNEEVTGGTGLLSVRNDLDNALVYSVPASAVTSTKLVAPDPDAGKWKAVIKFGGALASTTDYFVVFPKGYIKDMSGNAYGDDIPGLAVPENYNDWNITSSDFAAPVVTFATTTVAAGPANITGALTADDIRIIFNEAVVLADGSGWPGLTDYANWSKYLALQKDGVNVPAEFSYAANTITINPTSNFTSNTVYTVIMRAGIVKDVSPNANVLAEAKTITVTTADFDVLTATFGPVGNLVAATPLTVKFNKAVRAITTTTPFDAPLTNANVEATLKLEKTETPGATITVDPADYVTTYDAASMTITVVPAAGKAWATSSAAVAVNYTLSVLGGTIEDNQNNALALTTSTPLWPVNDYKKPVATLVANELTYVSLVPGNLLTITFDEPVTMVPATLPETAFFLKSNDAQGNNLPFTVGVVGNVVTLTPTAQLELGKTYYYGVGASMADFAGNVNLAAYKSVKIVGVVIPPTVDALTYTVNGGAVTPIADTFQGATVNAGGDIVVKVTFNVNVDDKDLTAINTVATTFAPGNLPVTIISDNVSGKVLTITIPDPVIAASEPGTEYTITIPAGLLEANEAYTGTTFAQMSGPVVIKVKTKDTQLPTFTAVPAGLGIAADAVVKFTFSEPVTPVAGKTITFKTGATVEETVSITSANVVKDGTITDGTVWEVKHAAFVKYGTAYTIVVGKDAFVDAAANNLGAADITLLDHFTIIGNPAPLVSVFTPKDEADMVSLTPEMTILFNEPVEQASITGSRKLIYVIEKKGAADAIINGAGDLVLGGDDVQKYFAYVDDLTKVAVDGSTVTIKGVTLEAAKQYYVLITPGAFKDKSLGVPAAQVFGGITSYGALPADPWNFTTSDVYAPTVELSFNRKGADNLAATNSDIILTFSKKIVKFNGSAITNSDISLAASPLIILEKWDGATWVNIKFTGTITNESVITIDNSSLVILNEMKTGTNYRVSFAANTLKGKDSGTVLDPYTGPFWTTDATAPTAPVIAYQVDEVNSVFYDATKGHTIKVKITATDVNSGLPDHTAIKTYYLKSTYAGPLTANDVKGLAEATDDHDFEKTWEGGMDSKTKYYIYAVAEDVAGNLSAVSQKEVMTDDVVKPALAGALPTSFDAAGNISLVFNEAVKPVVGGKARVIDNATGIVYLMPLANATALVPADLNTITIVGGAFAQMSLDVAQYTIEIDPGMIVDVPRQVATVNVNAPNAWDGIVGTSFQVASKDQVKPTMGAITPSGNVALNQAFTISFNEPVNLNNTFTQFVVTDVTDPLVPTPYDVVNTSEISGQGTNAIIVSPKRALVSGKSYSLVITDLVFSDLSGNVMNTAILAARTVNYTGKDVVGLAATYKADATSLPAAAPLATVPVTLTIDLGEAFFLTSALDPNINTFDLQSHVYLMQDGTPVSFTAMKSANTIVLSNLNGTGLGSAAKGKSYTFGFVNLYEANGNMTASGSTMFSVAADAIVNQVVTFIPGDNNGNPASKVNIPVTQEFVVEFNGIIYSYHATVEALNNLIVDAAWLNTNNVFTMATAPIKVTKLETIGGKSVVTIKPDAVLSSEVTYTLTLNPNLIQIGQGLNPLLTYTETFITGDVKAPKLIADGSGNTLPAAYKPVKVGVIGKDQTLALEFDEKVIGAGQVVIHRWDGVVMAAVDISGVVSTSVAPWVIKIGTPAEIMASNPLFITDEDYYIEVPAGVITDMASTPNAFSGILAVNEWKISLRDDTTPQVVFVDDTKDGMAVDTKIKLTFDRPVEMGMGWIALYYQDGKAVDLIRTTSGAVPMNSYDFTLSQKLAPNTKFWVELGAGTFDLAADNSIKQEQQSIGAWYFTTEVNSVPVATVYSPDKGATDVALTSGLSITFDQKVVAGTGNVQLHRKQSAGGPIITNFDVTDATKVTFVDNTLTIAGDVLNLQNNSEYYVIVPGTAVKNTSSTPEFWPGVIVPFEWQFTTLNDQVAPTAVYAPNGALAVDLVPADIKLTMTFDEPVVAGVGNLVIYDSMDVMVETIAVSQSMFAGQVVTLMPTKLVESMSYYVMVDAGAVKDLGGTGFAGIANKTDWTFATGDFTAPSLVSWDPKGQLTDNHPTFKVTFDSPVQYGTAGNLKVYKVGSTTPALTIPVTASMVSGSVVTVSYVANATTGLDKFTDYYVLVDAGVVKDMAGNAAPGVTDPTAWTFKTGDFKTAIEPSFSLEFKVYPNPFVDYVNVANASLLSKIVVTNIAGQTVKQVVNPTERIQLNELRSGVYFMSMYDMDNVVKGTAKIVKR